MILIVDDFRDGAEALCKLLGAMGYPCEVCDDPHEALAVVRSFPAEQALLVVMDQMMPGMTGTDVLKALRADEKTARVPVLFLSAGFDLAARDEALSLGAVAWVLKGGGKSGDLTQTLKTIGDWYERVGGVKREKRKPGDVRAEGREG